MCIRDRVNTVQDLRLVGQAGVVGLADLAELNQGLGAHRRMACAGSIAAARRAGAVSYTHLVGQHDLPFGGVGESGMGHYHGHEGFQTFSKMRPVFYQTRLSTLKFLWPPYGKFADRVMKFLIG